MTQYIARDSALGFSRQSAIRSTMLAGMAALGLALGACGGGGSGGQLASTPPPPPTPTPLPTPTPPGHSLLPGKKSVSPPVQFATDGSTPIVAGGAIDIPLTFTAVGAGFIGDQGAINAGAVLTAGGAAPKLNGMVVGSTLAITISESLDYTRFGYWVESELEVTEDVYDTRRAAAFAGGLETPYGEIPTSGNANYSGSVLAKQNQDLCYDCVASDKVTGTVNLAVNFGNRSLTGLMSNLGIESGRHGSGAVNDISFTASFANAQNWFSGTTAVASAPSSPYAFGSNASGSLVGSFYGPSAREIGAVWTLSDGVRKMIGSFGAKTGN